MLVVKLQHVCATLHSVSMLHKQIGCFDHRVGIYHGCRKMVVMRSLFLALETNCIRQLERQLPSSSYNHNTLTTLRTSVRESPACIKSMEAPYYNFEVHL